MVILEVFSFKEEGLVTPEGSEGEKGKLKICCFKGELNPDLLHEMQECWPQHHPEFDVRLSRLESYEIKADISPILHLPDWDDRYWLLELTYYYRTLDQTSTLKILHLVIDRQKSVFKFRFAKFIRAICGLESKYVLRTAEYLNTCCYFSSPWHGFTNSESAWIFEPINSLYV